MPNKRIAFAPFAPLADRYATLIKSLDLLIAEAIIVHEEIKQRGPETSTSSDLQNFSRLLDESVLQLRAWANELTHRTFSSMSERFAMRDLDTHSVLRILDAGTIPVADDLRRVFDKLEADALTLSRLLGSNLQVRQDDWTSHKAQLESIAGNIQQAILELDHQKQTIDAQMNSATAEEIEQALLYNNVSAKGTVLSIDGGGIRSASSILIIKRLMGQIRSVIESAEIADFHIRGIGPADVRPADVFEYVFGSSSGGLIAIMLGRLKMQEDHCLDAFHKNANEIFSHPRSMTRVFRSHKYSTEILNRAVKHIVGDFDPNPENYQWKRNLFAEPGDRSKTGVIAYDLRGSTGSPKILRTYKIPHESDSSSSEPETSCQIWEAARATSAAPGYFPPMTLGQSSFVDGGFGTNNPALEALKEIQALRKAQSRRIHFAKPLVISIGSGLTFPMSKSTSSSRLNIILAAKCLLTNTERVHADMLIMAERQEVDYFRFEVDSGLEDVSIDSWEVKTINGEKVPITVQKIADATANYLMRAEVKAQLHQCARLLVKRCSSNSTLPQAAPGLFTVPQSRNPDFVGREDILNRINEAFHNQRHSALVGLAGVGKTEIAIEFGYRYRKYHPNKSVFWLQADSPISFEHSIRSLAEVLKLPGREGPEANILQRIYDWLSHEAKDGWLMILDNLENEEIFDSEFFKKFRNSSGPLRRSSTPLSALLPQNPKGHILITSRSKTFANSLTGSYKTVIEVEPMSESESVQLFLKCYQGDPDQDDANRLTQYLGFLPLAIVQIAGYLNQRAPRLTTRALLTELQKDRTSLFKRDTAGAQIYERTLGHVWRLSLEQITPSARRLLSLMSLCNPDNIPDYLIRTFHDKGNVEPQRKLDLDFEDNISSLVDLSLVKVDRTGHFFSVHRLVPFEMRRSLSSLELTKLENEYIMTLSALYSKDVYGEWLKCGQLAPHLDTALAYRPADGRHLWHWTDIVTHIADYAVATGNYSRAKELHVRALQELEKLQGPGHSNTMTSVAKLGMVYVEIGEYEMAEIKIRRALEGREKVLGSEHPDTMDSYNNLGILLRKQGKYEQAENICQQTLDRRMKLFGSEHPDTLASLDNLALILEAQCKYEEAEKLNQQTLQTYERTLGSDHPLTLNSTCNLALILQHQGRYDAAEAMHRRTLEGRLKFLGRNHPDTLISMANLATNCVHQARFQEAEELRTQVLETRKSILGVEHPDTLTSMADLAFSFKDRGRNEEALVLMRNCVELSERVLGSEHPQTKSSAGTLYGWENGESEVKKGNMKETK